MTDVQELAKKLGVKERAARQLIWSCVKEGVIPPPERGKGGRLILSEETKRILPVVHQRRKREISIVSSLAEEFQRTPMGIRHLIQRLAKRGAMPPPERVRGKIVLTLPQINTIREHYRWIEGDSPTIALAKELGVSDRWVRMKVHKLAKQGVFPPLEKRRRGSTTELVLTQEMEEKIRESFVKGAN